jgi:hypothetical protein
MRVAKTYELNTTKVIAILFNSKVKKKKAVLILSSDTLENHCFRNTMDSIKITFFFSLAGKMYIFGSTDYQV